MSSRHTPDISVPPVAAPDVAAPDAMGENRFLTVPVGRLFLSNALPMVLIMAMNGLLNLVDAAFLGRVVGADALAAVSLVFPPIMVTIALSTLVSGGMSSLLARHLGAGEAGAAASVFARAHGLVLAIAALLIGLLFAGGEALIGALAGGNETIAGMARDYLWIMICATPVQFVLGLHADAWRNEGRAGLMALLSVFVTLANIALNWLLIVELDQGVAGSAWGTVLAQLAGLALLIGLRARGEGVLAPGTLLRHAWVGGWSRLLALGAPLSLSFIGLALVSGTVIATLNASHTAGYADTIAAYGVVTRLLGFAFLPLMALALAMQAIVGNNVGAGLYARSDAVLRLATRTAFVYGAGVALGLGFGGGRVAAGFSTDAAVVAEVARILGVMMIFYVVSGPILMLALYFQAIGQPGRAALLTLVKPFVLSPVLIAAFGALGGPALLWFAFPVGDAVVMVLASAVVLTARRGVTGFGLKREGLA